MGGEKKAWYTLFVHAQLPLEMVQALRTTLPWNSHCTTIVEEKINYYLASTVC